MGYELYFIASTAAVPDRASFERHFAGRARYSVVKGAARYANEDTDASFAFDCLASKYPNLRGPRPWARFTLDYRRPSFFAEESLPELQAFSERFGASAVYPGPTPAPYTTPAFLRSWEEGNREACGPFPDAAPPNERPLVLPRAQLLAVWQWNYRRKALQAEEGGALFVPRIWFVRTAGGVGTCVVWPDAMAARVPQVDTVVFSREALAPHSSLGRRPDAAVVPWSAIAGSITGQAFFDSQIANWRVTDRRVLTGLAKAVVSFRGTTDLPDLLTGEMVLDREGFAGTR